MSEALAPGPGGGFAGSLKEGLSRGAQALGLALSETMQSQLLDYLALVQKWTRVYNLTALREPQDMLTHHLLDSLSVLTPLLKHTGGQPIRLLDVGSGGGLPGVVLAICCPQIQVCCVDAVAKKVAFIQQVAASLRLPNLRGQHARVQTLQESYDVVCSRAFASLKDFTQWSRPVLAEGGVWMAMKGKMPVEERQELPADIHVFHVEPLHVPGLDAERFLLWLKPAAAGAG